MPAAPRLVSQVDYVLPPNAALEHAVPTGMETALAYVYAGGVRASSPARDVPFNHAVLFDATTDARTVVMTAGAEGASVMLFSGQRLDQPVAWHGPFVMTTQAEITATIAQYRSGDFPPVRVPWDYRVSRIGRAGWAPGPDWSRSHWQCKYDTLNLLPLPPIPPACSASMTSRPTCGRAWAPNGSPLARMPRRVRETRASVASCLHPDPGAPAVSSHAT